MSQKDTILDVLRRAQQPLQPKISKQAGETPAARRSAKEKGEGHHPARPNHALGEGRKAPRAGKKGLQNFGQWLSGDFSMPRAGLYLGVLVGLLLAFGAYKIGVRKGGMGGTAYGMGKTDKLAQVPPLGEHKAGQQDRGQQDREQRDQGKSGRRSSGPASERITGNVQRITDLKPKETSKAQIPTGPQKNASKAPTGTPTGQGHATNEKPLQVLRLLSNPDSNDSRMKITAMRSWLRKKLEMQSSSSLRSVKVYFWLSKSSRAGGSDSACLEVTLPKGWTHARLIRELSVLGRVSADGFTFDFGEIRNNSMARKRLPSEIAASLEQEKMAR